MSMDPRGPIVAPAIVPTLRPDGVEAVGYRAGAAPPTPTWVATWIWLGAEAQPTAVACFRREVVLADAPGSITAWISADLHYRLWVNGRLAARGPADAGQDYPGGKNHGSTGLRYADHRDLTAFFAAGANVIAVEVFGENLGPWYGTSGHRGLFFQADVVVPGHPDQRLLSDGEWRGMPGAYLGGGVHHAEHEPQGWRLPGFAGAWPACAAAGDHWPHLVASELPPPLELVYPAQAVVRSMGIQVAERALRGVDGDGGVVVEADSSFAVRYDRILSGYAGIAIRGGAGATVTIDLNEIDAPGGRRSFVIHPDGGLCRVETPFYSSFSVINVRIELVGEALEIIDVTAIFTSYPVAYRGAFACSDPELDRLWASCRWATQLCMQDHYLDSPDHQEPCCDPGDYLIEGLLNHYAFGDRALSRQELRTYAALLDANDAIVFHTSYALLWLQMLIDHHDLTADAALVRELAPQVHAMLDRFAGWRGANGLISEVPDYMFMDWVRLAGFELHHPPAVIGQGYLTAFFHRGLADGQRVAALCGDDGRVERYAELRSANAAAFAALWSPEHGLYRDGRPFQTTVKPGPWLPPDQDIETFSPHVNVLAVLYDLAPRERQAAIIDALLADQPLNCQPYFMHFVFAALDHCGRFHRHALALMRRWRIDPATQTFAEMWDTGDLSHAWGGTPLYQMSARILGVTPAEPGFAVIGVRPTPCPGLTWAKGRVPTPHGGIEVAWEAMPAGFRLDLIVPAGARAEVALPTDLIAGAAIRHDGRPIAMAPTGTTIVVVPAGAHRLEIDGTWRP